MLYLLVFSSPSSLNAIGQSQTTGGLAGVVRDQNGGLIAGVTVTVLNRATGDERRKITDAEGNYAFALLPSGTYRVRVAANGFNTADVESLQVVITETKTLDVELSLRDVSDQVLIRDSGAPMQTGGPQLGRVVGSRMLSELPLATGNFTQILALSSGTSVDLANNAALGRNSQSISVNGARVTSNSFQINGVDANNIGNGNAYWLAVPAPETIHEFKVQTSLYDATYGRSAGGNIQVVTRSGGNDVHGAVYEYFRNTVLNANNPFLKAAGIERPPLSRHAFGALTGGPIKRDKAFFFVSYQGTRERNGASSSSLSESVLIAPGLTDDRSEQTLINTFKPSAPIHPVSLNLLNQRLPGGQYLIPTPQPDGRYTGSAISRFREDQFNTNLDYLINDRASLALKVFVTTSTSLLALNESNVPGFNTDDLNDNQVISLQYIQSVNAQLSNEARLGYNFIRENRYPQVPVKDSDLGIYRANAAIFPGLGSIRIGGLVVGSSFNQSDVQGTDPSVTLADTLSIVRGRHNFRAGAEVIYFQRNVTRNTSVRGLINFGDFNSFLIGSTLNSQFGTGIHDRSLRTTDYSLFLQDDWRLTSKLTLNLGLRYELDPPYEDLRGRDTTFDPALYRPRMSVDSIGSPVGPPVGGFVQSGKVIPQYDLPDVPNVSNHLLTGIDANNFAPRLGFAYSPLASGRLVIRGGYGIFYSRVSTFYLGGAILVQPGYVTGRRVRPQLADPYFPVPAENQFPTFVENIALFGSVFDRNMGTPYLHQYNSSVQYGVTNNMTVEIAYVGSRGANLLRTAPINQARLASPQQPIVNDVTGEAITTNTTGNAGLRAPYQGVDLAFTQKQTSAESAYDSLQVSLTRRLSSGLQLLASYTYGKSIDTATATNGGAGNFFDSSNQVGNENDPQANRGVSDFDRRHRFVVSYLWDLPTPAFAAQSRVGRLLLSEWQLAGIAIVMSGRSLDIIDSLRGGADSFYGMPGRPNFASGANRETATSSIPPGYFFNPFAFARAVVRNGEVIPSSNGKAIATGRGTDFGVAGRNVLTGPSQRNLDFSMIKRFRITENKNIEFRAEFFNVFNQVNFANPVNDVNAILSSEGGIDVNSGQIINPGDFGRIIATSGNPRLIQFAIKFNY